MCRLDMYSLRVCVCLCVGTSLGEKINLKGKSVVSYVGFSF